MADSVDWGALEIKPIAYDEADMICDCCGFEMEKHLVIVNDEERHLCDACYQDYLGPKE